MSSTDWLDLTQALAFLASHGRHMTRQRLNQILRGYRRGTLWVAPSEKVRVRVIAGGNHLYHAGDLRKLVTLDG